MKLITRNTDYAVRAVSYIAKNSGRVVSVTELVKKLRIPKPFLRKILQVLNKEGLARSYKGIGGGFVLAAKPGRILLVDIMKAFQGPLELNECAFKKLVCPNAKNCPLKSKIDRIEKHVMSELGTITIGELIK